MPFLDLVAFLDPVPFLRDALKTPLFCPSLAMLRIVGKSLPLEAGRFSVTVTWLGEGSGPAVQVGKYSQVHGECHLNQWLLQC